MNEEPVCDGKPTKVKILLSGIGLIGRKHAELIIKSNRSTLVGIVAPRNSHNLSNIAALNVLHFDTISSAIDALDVDAVILACPNEFHMSQTVECIKNKIPVLVEKPMTASLSEAKELHNIAKSSDTPVLVGHHRTYNSLLPAARDFITSREFGRLVAVQGAALFYKPDDYFEEGPWRKFSGGGPILINLIHEIGIMRYLCGEIEAVFAHSSNRIRGFEVEDTISISLSFDNGALGTFILSDAASSNKSWEMTSGENPTYPYSSNTNCYHFAGTNGSLDFPTFNARFFDNCVTPSWWKKMKSQSLCVTSVDALANQLEHFEDIVLTDKKPRVSTNDGFLNMCVIEAIQISIKVGKTIAVKDMY